MPAACAWETIESHQISAPLYRRVRVIVFRMNPFTHQLTTPDGTRLHVTDFLIPEGRGGVVIMHGIGEHSGRYRHVVKTLNGAGWSVRTYDHRGHGQSEGTRGDVNAASDLLMDGKAAIDDFADRIGAAPILLGHSMGGLFAAHFALARLAPLKGLVLSSPALSVPLTVVQRLMLKIMHAVAPHVGVPNGLDAAHLSHDAQVIADYRNDPLVHGKISANLLQSMLTSVAYCSARAGSLAMPTLMLVAGSDRLVDASGSQRFFASSPPGRAEFIWYEDFYHEVFNERDCPRPLGALCAWLANQDAL